MTVSGRYFDTTDAPVEVMIAGTVLSLVLHK